MFGSSSRHEYDFANQGNVSYPTEISERLKLSFIAIMRMQNAVKLLRKKQPHILATFDAFSCAVCL